jgi:phosphoglycolate phosphatase
MSARLPETVIFDLDGTLVDTAPDLAAALNASLIEEGLAPVTLTQVRHMVGRGARVLIERATVAAGRQLPARRIDDLVGHFLEHYEANISAGSRPFDGVLPLLRDFTNRGVKLGVCTNKPEALSLKLLSHLGMKDFFPAILGADSRPWHKPDPRHLTETIAALGGEPGKAVLVGDSETDVRTARAAGIPIVLVSFGYTETPVEDLAADTVIDHFDALEQALAGLPRA